MSPKFDLGAVDTKSLSDCGVQMVVRKLNSPDALIARNGMPVTITLLGPDSAAYRDFSREQVRKRIARAQDQKDLSTVDFQQVEADGLELLINCTVEWENVLDTSGLPIECNPDNVRALYVGYPVVREQVDSFVVSRANFLPPQQGN
jgi:hypothetical protein